MASWIWIAIVLVVVIIVLFILRSRQKKLSNCISKQSLMVETEQA